MGEEDLELYHCKGHRIGWEEAAEDFARINNPFVLQYMVHCAMILPFPAANLTFRFSSYCRAWNTSSRFRTSSLCWIWVQSNTCYCCRYFRNLVGRLSMVFPFCKVVLRPSFPWKKREVRHEGFFRVQDLHVLKSLYICTPPFHAAQSGLQIQI